VGKLTYLERKREMSWRNEAHNLIIKCGYKVGMRVRIAKDISITNDRHSKTREMDDMAESNITYKIENISHDYIYVNGFMWAPQDIYLDEDSIPDPLPQTNIMFDPNEIVL